MKELWSRTQSKIIVSNLVEAKTMRARAQGLLGTASLCAGEGLWIHHCNSVHTWFMKYSIDLIFLDKEMQIVKLCKNVGPFRMTLPKWSASSVVEVEAGVIDKLNLQVGEQLYVGS